MATDNWFDHALQRTRWRPRSQVIALGTLGFFIALILGALYLSQVASEVTMNRELADMLALRDELERSNEQLRVNIAEDQRVSELEQRALALGFVKAAPGQIEYIAVEGYSPAVADTVAPLSAEEEAVPIYDETFTDWLRRQTRALQEQINNLLGG